MREIVHILVKLRVPDLVALTAKWVIIENMKISQLQDIQREDWWQMQIGCGLSQKEEVENYVRNIVERTPLFVNPNKHTYRLWTGSSLLPAQSAISNLQSVYVGVWYYDEMSCFLIKKTLREQLLYEKVEDVKRGTLWTLKIKSKSKSEAKKVAQAITLCSNRKRGLLSNPHLSYYQIF